ncbi:porin [Undibacterium arcticum]
MAVLGSVAGVAQAQSAVIVYGVVDVGLAHENNGSTSVTRMDSGILNGSRLGFKGSEDLGSGLSAIFFKSKVASTLTPAHRQMQQNCLTANLFVGLTGGFGAVKLGRQMNPVYANNGTFDPFADGLAGDSARLFSYNGSRTDNLITYGYAANGFRGELQYGLGEVPGNLSASRTVAGFVGYKKNGPVDVVLTHQNIKNPTDTNTTKITLLGGNYNFGVVKAFASYAWEKKGVVLGTATRLDQRDSLVGLTAPVGTVGTLLISYIRKTDKAVTNADASQVAIGYTHNLSKRTALSTSYGELRNDGAAKYKVAAPGNIDKLFNVGIRHFF